MVKNMNTQRWLWSIFVILVLSWFIYTLSVIVASRQDTAEIIAEVLHSPQMVLQLQDFSEERFAILLKVEDPNFYSHHGVDLSTPGAGITTITQGLAKQLYFEKFKPGMAKYKQALIARFALDPLVSKEDQLRLFINYAYFGQVNGRGVYGFAKAAQVYYQKSFQRLEEDEYLALVAMLISPNVFNPLINQPAITNRVRRIKLLLKGEYKPKGLMDLYYGGEYFEPRPRSWLRKLVWGY